MGRTGKAVEHLDVLFQKVDNIIQKMIDEAVKEALDEKAKKEHSDFKRKLIQIGDLEVFSTYSTIEGLVFVESAPNCGLSFEVRLQKHELEQIVTEYIALRRIAGGL